MYTTTYFEQDSLIGLAVRAMARAILCPLWWALQSVVAIGRHWRPVAVAVAVAGCVAVCAAFPALPVAVALIAAFGWATWPR